MSCDVTEKELVRSFPDFARKTGQERTPRAKFLYSKGVVTWMCGYAAGKKREESLALLGNTCSVLNIIRREELMGWHPSGVKRTTDWSYRGLSGVLINGKEF